VSVSVPVKDQNAQLPFKGSKRLITRQGPRLTVIGTVSGPLPYKR